MTTLLLIAAVTASLLVATTAGYFAALQIIVWIRRRRQLARGALPRIAVVVPTLNEATFIEQKLRDLRRSDYPSGCMTILVVDGGSTDGTADIVQRAVDAGGPIRMLRLNRTRGHSEQGMLALGLLSEDIVVLTDADSRLDPSCIRHLVTCLEDDPQLAVAGAAVEPDSALPEERLHWRVLNRLWWLEGEALAAGSVSGVCYAVRRVSMFPLADIASALDMHLALVASARGFRVKLCRQAHAIELRVPQSTGELIALRRRRGRNYVAELQRAWTQPNVRLGSRLACGIHLWHFHVTPRLAGLFVVVLTVLLFTDRWRWSLGLAASVVAPVCLVVLGVSVGRRHPIGLWRDLFAGCRLLALTWFSLLTIRPPFEPSVPEIPDAASVDNHDGVSLHRPPVSHAPPLRRSGDAAERVQPAM